MSTIRLKCNDQVLYFAETPVIASGGFEEDYAEFEFCSKWDGFVKVAVFYRTEEKAYHVILDETNTCQVPPEVTADEGVIYFGVFGVNSEGQRRTSETLIYNIRNGAIISATRPTDPTPDIYTQMLAYFAEAKAKYEEAREVVEQRRNPNLLDNWYFADPIDQRGGYVVPSGVQYCSMADASLTGTTDKCYKVDFITTNGYENAVFTIDGTQYYVTKGNYVRGYVGSGYTIDRWLIDGSAVSLTIHDGHLALSKNTTASHGHFLQRIYEDLRGKKVTFSILRLDGTLLSTSKTVGESWAFSSDHIGNAYIGVQYNTTRGCTECTIYFNSSAENTLELLAAKLELGSVQTLAYQDADGSWVLNDPPPDKGLELLKCCMSTVDSADTYANNKVTANAVNAVNKAGDTMTGRLYLSPANNGKGSLYKNASATADYGTVLADDDASGNNVLVNLIASQNKMSFRDVSGAYHTFLHTGNLSDLGVAKIATGSYTGTGTYGADNPCTLTFDFKPKVLLLTRASDMLMPDGYYFTDGISATSLRGMAMFTSDETKWYGGAYTYTTEIGGYSYGADLLLNFEWGDDSVSWYGTIGSGNTSDNASKAQFNGSGTKYYYVAIG